MSDPKGEFKDSQMGRRWSDGHPGDKEPTNGEIWRLLIEIRDRVARIESRAAAVDTAFVVDDLGRPDYDGHRASHRRMIKDAEAVDQYKMDATKKVIGIAIGVVVLLLTTGFAQELVAKLAK